jgi:hypothetical protein
VAFGDELLDSLLDARLDCLEEFKGVVLMPSARLCVSVVLLGQNRAHMSGSYPECSCLLSKPIWWLAIGLPEPSKMMKRVDVVPWSILPTNHLLFFSSSVTVMPSGRYVLPCAAAMICKALRNSGPELSAALDCLIGCDQSQRARKGEKEREIKFDNTINSLVLRLFRRVGSTLSRSMRPNGYALPADDGH